MMMAYKICGYRIRIHLSQEIACVCHTQLNFKVTGDFCFGRVWIRRIR